MTTELEGRGGPGWRYQCKSCGHEVGIDAALPKVCPGCQATGWWGKFTCATRRATNPSVPNHTEQICHPITDGDMHGCGQNNGDCGGLLTPAKPEGIRGPKFRAIPDDLVLELAGQGNGAKRIAMALADRGIMVSSRTIHRRLVAAGRGHDHDGSTS